MFVSNLQSNNGKHQQQYKKIEHHIRTDMTIPGFRTYQFDNREAIETNETNPRLDRTVIVLLFAPTALQSLPQTLLRSYPPDKQSVRGYPVRKIQQTLDQTEPLLIVWHLLQYLLFVVWSYCAVVSSSDFIALLPSRQTVCSLCGYTVRKIQYESKSKLRVAQIMCVETYVVIVTADFQPIKICVQRWC